MKRLVSIIILMSFLSSAALLLAEEQVQKPNPPTSPTAEQVQPAQPAPAISSAPAPAIKPDSSGINKDSYG